MSRIRFLLTRTSILLSFLAAVTLVAQSSLAQDIYAEPPPIQPTESDIRGLVSLQFGSYKPNIDGEFGGHGPYETMFGGGGGLLTALAGQGHVYQGIGKLSIEGRVGFFNKKGFAYGQDGTESADRTSLMIVPLSASLVYRFDYLQERFRFPLNVSVQVGLDYALWNVKNAGMIADGATGDGDILVGRGGTWGWHYGVGLYLWLNWIAPSMAAAFDATTGINNTYLFAEFIGRQLDDFGSTKSWDLSDNTFMFGLAFEF